MSWGHRDLKSIIKRDGKYYLDGEKITSDDIIIRKGWFKDIKKVPDDRFPFVYEATIQECPAYVLRGKKRAWIFRNTASDQVLDKVYGVLNSDMNKIFTLILCLEKNPLFTKPLIQYIAKYVYRSLQCDKKQRMNQVDQYKQEIDKIHVEIQKLYRQIEEKQALIKKLE